MRTREQGGLRFSAVGLGTYALSGAYGPVDLESARRTVDRALDLGVTVFDTSDSYDGAEEVLAGFLGSRRNEVVLATKIGAREGMEARLDAGSILRACEESLRRLRTDRIDLYQIHFDDPLIPVEEPIGALEQLKREGKIRAYGIGHATPGRAVEYLSGGRFATAMLELSPLERGALRSMAGVCEDRGVGMLAFSVTGRGLLSGRIRDGSGFTAGDIRRMDPLFRRERLESGLRVADGFRRRARSRGTAPTSLAVAWVLAQPSVVCALTGTMRPEHLEENVAGASLDLHESEIAAIDRMLEVGETELRQAQERSLESILGSALPESVEAAFHDLIYAAETAVALHRAFEEEVIPPLRGLLALRHAKRADRPALERVQSQLAEAVGIVRSNADAERGGSAPPASGGGTD